MSRIYLDNNATTGVDPRVLTAMLETLSSSPANPSSTHYFGQEARNLLSKARGNCAEFFQVKPNEIIFTSGGTESLNMVLRGLFEASSHGHIISSDVEHSAVFNTLTVLEKRGINVTYLPAGLWGAVRPEAVAQAIRSDTRLIVLSAVNSETGVKIDLEAIARIAENAGIPLLIDGVALLGKELFQIPSGVSAMAFSGHKLHAPKGVGMAFIRSSLRLVPLLTGGDQEYGKRAGTENLAGIIGFSTALSLLREELPAATERMRLLRDQFEQRLKDKLEVIVNGEGPRIVNTSNLSFPGLEGESLLLHLDMEGVAVSHGSACSSGALEPSRILRNMGLPKERSRSALRFSLSRWTTEAEIERCIAIIISLSNRLRLPK